MALDDTQAEIVRKAIGVLETTRDYVDDAANGFLWGWRQKGDKELIERLDKLMAAEDLALLDAALNGLKALSEDGEDAA